jgi:formyl-CoA transferase
MPGPLSGVTVLDLSSYLAGPYGCTLLADLGADVIKIESPQGDMLRQFPSSLPGEARFFLGTNRGKRALALDLKQKEGLAVLHRMVESADVLVENYRPGAFAALGLGYEALSEINPRLVYCSISAFGQDGPRREQTAYDHVIQATSGIMAMTGTPEANPIKFGSPAVDYATGMTGAFALSRLCTSVSALERVSTSTWQCLMSR